MLDGAGDQVLAGFHRADQGEIVGLGPAGGENDLPRLCAQQCSDPGARLIHRVVRLTAEAVHT